MHNDHLTAINQSLYILENSDQPEGMVRMWAEQARLGRITYTMMLNMQARYIELGGEHYLRSFAPQTPIR